MDSYMSLNAIVDPVISLVPRAQLRDTLRRAFREEDAAVRSIEEFFRVLPCAAWSNELLCTFVGSWKATHLKMLAIYGLSCRLQRTADGADDVDQSNLYVAAARNAATSFEDLGLDFDGHTHADLFESFAEALVGDDVWKLRRYLLPEASRFTGWVYRNMVVEAIHDGLLTNMFSEIYNHGEYSIALPATDAYFRQHTRLTEGERCEAVSYIAAHVTGNTEADHFLVVVEALDRYLAASRTQFDPARADFIFRSYLQNLAPVMQHLTAMMRSESARRGVERLTANAGGLSAPQSVPSPLRTLAPVQRFQRFEAAVLAMARYEVDLCANASSKRSSGATVIDQDQPDEVFCLSPAHPSGAPLAIVGGMGPLTGARAFRQACTRFRDSRTVVLYQACSIPDRSAPIWGAGATDSPARRAMALQLADALRQAVDVAAGPGTQAVRCIIACNTAHYFLPLPEPDLQQTAPRRARDVQMVSLVESCVAALKILLCQKTLLLTTEGARVGQVFSAPFRDAGICFEEPSPAQGRLLMRVIFEGMKSLDEGRAVELGNEFFETVLQTGSDYDSLVAGCTEIPLTINLLRLRGSSAVASFLSRVKIIDPLEEALCRA